MLVDIEIFDQDAQSNCGFIAFDHFYQADKGQAGRPGGQAGCAVAGQRGMVKSLPPSGVTGRD